MFETLGFEDTTAREASVLFGLGLGLAFGVLAQLTRFCLRRALVGDDRRAAMGVWLTALAVAVIGTQAAVAAGCKDFVFSSTCATYGLPARVPMDETHKQAPINPYGRTKFIIEQALKDYGTYKDLKSVMLRYFNAAGADFEGRIGEWHTPETHAIPLAIEAALGRRQGFKVFGDDYDTRDGTCVRDYIHVLDLADAHVRAVDYLLAGGDTVELNLGTGTGTTVKELLDSISDVSGKPFPVEYVGRREGDSTSLVANNDKAKAVLGWEPQYSLQDIIRSAWDWHSKSNHILR